jgi:hypothetical protein
MDWVRKNWDEGSWPSAGVGIVAGGALALLGHGGFAEIAALLVALCVRWAIWQIPPPGRSKAPGTPPDGGSRLAAVAIVVLAVTLLFELVRVPFA